MIILAPQILETNTLLPMYIPPPPFRRFRASIIAFALFLTNSLPLWSAPGVISPNIKVDQFGYRPNDPKIAVIARPQSGVGAPSAYAPGATFKIMRWSDDAEMFSGSIAAWNSGATHAQSGDKVWWFDFSTFGVPGEYYVLDVANNVGSNKFEIGAGVYTDLLKMATKALFYQRCGVAIGSGNGGSWTHGACHVGANQDLACRLVSDPNNPATAKDLSGGWHDAGDYNKYVNFTNTPLHELLFAYEEKPESYTDDLNIPESGNGVADILDEAKYELDWLLKMQQSDGSVLSKVAVTGFQGASPPDSDNAAHYYGAASTSATLTVAGVFAHASVVFSGIPGYASYATLLRTKAEAAWNWAVANPSVVFSNAGFQSADPEVSTYERDALKTSASLMLYAATGTTTYKTHFESTYLNLQPMQWYYFYPFESEFCDVLLYATGVSGISASVKNEIKNRFESSVNTQADFFPRVMAQTDAYRAYQKDDDYVWGSNQNKSWVGIMYGQMVRLNLSPANHSNYRMAALDFLHYLHGTNAVGYSMLSNTGSVGADQPVTQLYHGWTGEGTAWDNDPLPGFLAGGVNKYYSGTNGYFSGQPVQKCFLDFNTSWPENSWEITEPGIYYQAMYIRFLGTIPDGDIVLPVSLVEFTGQMDKQTRYNVLKWRTATEKNSQYFAVERSTDGVVFKEIGRVAAKGESNTLQLYSFVDKQVGEGLYYYRLKTVDMDGVFAYSGMVVLQQVTDEQVLVFPNPANEVLNVVVHGEQVVRRATILNMFGQVVREVLVGAAGIPLTDLTKGVYWLEIEMEEGRTVVRKFVKE
jgi:hypothetical protein